MKKLLLPALLVFSAGLSAAIPAAAAGPASLTPKSFPLTGRLVLPYYEVETIDPNGDTMLFAIRNESIAPVEVDIKYFEIDTPVAPQHTERVTLAGKQIKPVNIRDVPNLETDPDGVKRGYVVFEQVSGNGVIAGDYFRVDRADNFASGSRLVNADPSNAADDRCSNFTFRFLRGGAFSGGTKIFYWIDSTVLPAPDTLAYSIYNEAGALVSTGTLPNLDRVASSFNIETLLTGPAAGLNAGAVEIQFSGGMLGHVAGSMSASGLYSVGFEALCR
jgi:hypothetical protein